MGFGEQGQFSGEQGNKGLKIRGTQAIWGNRESRFCFGVTMVKGHFLRGEQENRCPLGGPRKCMLIVFCMIISYVRLEWILILE